MESTIRPAHCFARAQRLLATLDALREELGRGTDPRRPPEISNAKPREVYFEAIAAWHKATRLAEEHHACAMRPAPAAPAIREIEPGHVLQVLDAVLATLADVATAIGAKPVVAEPALEPARQPSDVLVALIEANRALSRLLERPPAPSDVYRTVALALAYAQRASKVRVEPAPLDRAKRPSDCYAQLEACLAICGKQLATRGETALEARVGLTDITPTDVFDLAHLVLGEVALLHAIDGNAPVHAFEPGGHGGHLPSHVFQLARTLEAQLGAV